MNSIKVLKLYIIISLINVNKNSEMNEPEILYLSTFDRTPETNAYKLFRRYPNLFMIKYSRLPELAHHSISSST